MIQNMIQYQEGLMKTEVVLKFIENGEIIKDEESLMKTEVVLK